MHFAGAMRHGPCKTGTVLSVGKHPYLACFCSVMPLATDMSPIPLMLLRCQSKKRLEARLFWRYKLLPEC